MNTGCTSLTILHILDHSLPLHSGYAFRSQDILRAQLKRGWQPVALTSPQHEKSWTGPWKGREEIDRVRYYRTGAVPRRGSRFAAACRVMSALVTRIREVVEEEHPDILHAHSPVLTALPALWVGRRLGLPVVYEIRAFWEDAATDHGTYGEDSWQYRLVRRIETWVCRRAAHVAVLSQGLKENLLTRGIPSADLTVVPNGISLDDFESCALDPTYLTSGKPNRKRVIGFVGSFYRYEGLDLLVEAVARLAATRSDVVLLLVGGGEMASALKAQVERLRLEETVLMPGRVPHDRIPGMYALMDILVYPRYSMPLTELVTPLKPLEAMVMRKAVVASDVGGHRELIRHGHNGILFPAGDVSALVEVLERLLDDSELRHSVERHGQRWVRDERSWDRVATVYADVYVKALARFPVLPRMRSTRSRRTGR